MSEGCPGLTALVHCYSSGYSHRIGVKLRHQLDSGNGRGVAAHNWGGMGGGVNVKGGGKQLAG